MNTTITYAQLSQNVYEVDNEYREYRPNPETLKAIEEVNNMMKHPQDFKTYTDVHQMFKELLA